MKKFLLLLILSTVFGIANAEVETHGGVIQHYEVVSDTVRVHFRQGYRILEPRIRDNREQLARIEEVLSSHHATDSVYKLRSIEIVGGASPEAPLALNQRLSYNRANVLFAEFEEYGVLPDSIRQYTFLGRDWGGLLRLAEQDPDLPYREETLEFLREIVDRCEGGEKDEDRNLARMMNFRNGEPYWYMYYKHFPDLRASYVVLTYEREPMIVIVPFDAEVVPEMPVEFADPVFETPQRPVVRRTPFYMGIRTNLLYDAALVPNIGAEFYLFDGWTIGANWMYAWWKSDKKHDYWRIYGGDVAIRKYFGKLASEKPLQGHHIGVYGQIMTFDFELGGKGYIGGRPGGSLWDKLHWGVGVEYGFSLPVLRHFNIDFTLGVGYLGGQIYEYEPKDGHYVWQETRNRNWFGPTKLEVSFVWLLGAGNYNRNK